VEDGDAETAIRVDIWVIKRTNKLEVWWAMGIVFGEGHLGLEVASIVHRLLVQDNEGDTPLEDIFVDELVDRSARRSWAKRGYLESDARRREGRPAYLNVSPFFFIQLPELIHEHTLGCVGHGVPKMLV